MAPAGPRRRRRRPTVAKPRGRATPRRKASGAGALPGCRSAGKRGGKGAAAKRRHTAAKWCHAAAKRAWSHTTGKRGRCRTAVKRCHTAAKQSHTVAKRRPPPLARAGPGAVPTPPGPAPCPRGSRCGCPVPAGLRAGRGGPVLPGTTAPEPCQGAWSRGGPGAWGAHGEIKTRNRARGRGAAAAAPQAPGVRARGTGTPHGVPGHPHRAPTPQ